MDKTIRLDRFMANAGAGTRSQVKTLLKRGLVQVNGSAEKSADRKILPGKDRVTLEGREILQPPRHVYLLLNKPAGCLSATEDMHQPTVLDLIPEELRRKGLFPVGRLDKDTEGLLLITDDGELAHRLLSPARHVNKKYFVRTDRELEPSLSERFLAGMDIGDAKKTLPAGLTITGSREAYITIMEGRYHQVKRMFAAAGYEVVYLRRVSMGGLVLPPELLPGGVRPLTAEELAGLQKEAGLETGPEAGLSD